MVLGPSRWLDQERIGSPLGTRQAIAAVCKEAGLHAVVMEDEPLGAGETNTALFTRLLRQHDVRHFLVYWPLGARLHGWEKEAGDLLRWLHDSVLSPRRVYLLVERRVTDHDPRGRVALSEPGNRTRYHEDFLAYGVRMRLWDDRDSLERHVQAITWEVLSFDAPRWHDALPALQADAAPR